MTSVNVRREGSPGFLDRASRAIGVGYLFMSALSFVLTCFLLVGAGDSVLRTALVASFALVILVVALALARGVEWPIALLSAAGLSVHLAGLILGSSSTSTAGEGMTVSALHPWVLYTLLLWILIRQTDIYQRHTLLQGVVPVLLLIAVAAVLPRQTTQIARRLLGSFQSVPSVSELLGQPAPPLHFEGPSGTIVTLEDVNKLYIVDFWSMACPPCLEELPRLAKLQQDLARRGDAELLLVTDRRTFEEAPAELKAPFKSAQVVFDEAGWAERLNVRGVPTKLFLSGGRVRAVVTGAVPFSTLQERITGLRPTRRETVDEQRATAK